MKNFKPTDRELFFSRHDPDDPRLGDLVQRDEGLSGTRIRSTEVGLFGYPDDEGVGLNGGRPGAKFGPVEIRRWLYRMTPHPDGRLKAVTDHGDLDINMDLLKRYDAATETIAEALNEGRRCLTLGGGNDYAYADGLAFLQATAPLTDSFAPATAPGAAGALAIKPVVINVDAHFDVRNTDRGMSSGTPFYRLLESGHHFEFVEFGIQSQCNAKAHWRYVKDKDGHIVSMEDYLGSGQSLLELTVHKLGHLWAHPRPCFLAVDLDAFSLPYSAGTSAGGALGLLPQDFYPVFELWLRRFDVRVLGLYEVAPPLDPSISTAKWAAQLAHGFLHDV